MKKICIAMLFLQFVTLPEVWSMPNKSDFKISFKKSPNLGRDGSFRFMQALGFARFKNYPGDQFSWKAGWEYYWNHIFSSMGTMSIALTEPSGLRTDYIGGGLNAHFFSLGDLEFVAGSHGGFSIINEPATPVKGAGTINFNLSAVWVGRPFYLGLYYHFIFETNYTMYFYEANDKDVNLNNLNFSIGVGYTI